MEIRELDMDVPEFPDEKLLTLVICKMEFKIVIEKLLGEFEKEKVRYALMGGFALGALGRKYSGS